MEYDFRTDILLIADDFYDAYKRCREGKNPVHFDGAIKYSACNIPAIVNGSFALELYFKIMLPPKTWGHKLKELYDNLLRKVTVKEVADELGISKTTLWRNMKKYGIGQDYSY